MWNLIVRDEDKGFTATKVLSEVMKWMERFDCLVIGPGLGRDPFLLVCFLSLLCTLNIVVYSISCRLAAFVFMILIGIVMPLFVSAIVS